MAAAVAAAVFISVASAAMAATGAVFVVVAAAAQAFGFAAVSAAWNASVGLHGHRHSSSAEGYLRESEA